MRLLAPGTGLYQRYISTAARGNPPAPPAIEVAGFDNLGIELDMRPHPALVGDEMEVPVGFLPAGIALGPRPFLRQFLREGETVVALAVGGRAGVTVPCPGSANIRGLVEDPFQRMPSARAEASPQPDRIRGGDYPPGVAGRERELFGQAPYAGRPADHADAGKPTDLADGGNGQAGDRPRGAHRRRLPVDRRNRPRYLCRSP